MAEFHPHEYQSTAIRWIKEHPRCALFLDMGLGKTVSTLTAFLELKSAGSVRRALVVAPKKVAETTWSSECAKWQHLSSLRVSAVLGTPKQRAAALSADADIYVIGRDSFVWLCDTYKNRLPFDTLVIDELTSFKSYRSQRFKAMKHAAKSFRRVIGLTGTPAPNGLEDLWAQLYCLDNGVRLGRFITHYRARYFDVVQRNFVILKITPKPGAEAAIRDKISDICLSMQAKDYLQLPSLIVHDDLIELTGAAYSQYKAFERERVASFLNGGSSSTVIADGAAVLLGKLGQMANGAVYDDGGAVHEVGDDKLTRLREIVEAAHSPVLVFYQYKHDVRRISAALRSYKVRLYGGASDLADWNAGRIDVLLAHPASTAFGLNMQGGGHYIAWFGTGWNLELYQQANARLHRQGQRCHVHVYNLVCRGTVDELALRALRGKASVQQGMMDALDALRRGCQGE